MAKRGLSVGTVMVLHALARGHQYGFDVLTQTGLTPGTVYPALERLSKLGMATSHWEEAAIAHAEKRPPRRYFEITDEGKSALMLALDRYKALAPVNIDGDTYPPAPERA